MKRIAWITFNAFIDTDIYIIKELLEYYIIDWHIIRSENDRFEYINIIEQLNMHNNVNIELHICGRRLRKIECIPYFYNLVKRVKSEKYDLVYTSMAGAPFFIPILALVMNKKKTVIAIHNVHVPKGGSEYLFFKLYNSFTYKRFHNFQTFSKSQYNELRKIIPKKNVYYAPFILKDYGKAKLKRTNTEITFLNFGNIREYKRIDVLIKAAQNVFETTQKKFRVIIAGKCDEWDKYKKIIKYDFLFDLRIYRVENDEIPELFNETDYFVAPYQDIAQSGSSIVALNYSKPIIASKLPAFEEYIINARNGYLIEPASEESLTAIIKEIIISNNSEYNNLVKNLEYDRNKYFSKEAVVYKYKEFIDEVIDKTQ